MPIALAQRHTLRILITTLAVAILLPLALLAYAAYTVNVDLHREAERRISIQLDALTQQTLRVLQTAELTLRAMHLLVPADLTDDQIRTRAPMLRDQFLRLERGMQGIQSLWLIAADGKPLVSDMAGLLAPAMDASDRDFVQAHRLGHVGTYIARVHLPKLAGPAFFSVSQPRDAPDGSFAGLFEVSLLPGDFESFYRDLAPERAEVYAMVRGDGEVLARFAPFDNPVSALDPNSSPLMRAVRQDAAAGRFTAISSIDGIERMFVYHRVPGYDAYNVIGINNSVLHAAWLASLKGNLMFAVPASLALIATCSARSTARAGSRLRVLRCRSFSLASQSS